MGFPGIVILSPETISSIVAAALAPELALAFLPLAWTPLNVQVLCASQPPPRPELDFQQLLGSPADALRALQNVAWPYFCQCVPGTPSPIPFPVAPVVLPPNWPSTPTFACDPADLCAALVTIQRDLATVTSTVGELFKLTTLLQRYSLPFAYVPGALHFGLSGEGSFAIPRCVGFQVNLATYPDGTLVLDSNPDYYWNMGWMSISGPAGMVQERRVTRLFHTWLPPACQSATQFAWSLKTGVTVDVRELYAEP